MIENFKEIMIAAKDACAEADCSECPFATGVYMPVESGYHFFCNLKKRPRDWDLSSDKPRLSKEGSEVKEKEKKTKTTTKRKTAKKTTTKTTTARKKKEK